MQQEHKSNAIHLGQSVDYTNPNRLLPGVSTQMIGIVSKQDIEKVGNPHMMQNHEKPVSLIVDHKGSISITPWLFSVMAW